MEDKSTFEMSILEKKLITLKNVPFWSFEKWQAIIPT